MEPSQRQFVSYRAPSEDRSAVVAFSRSDSNHASSLLRFKLPSDSSIAGVPLNELRLQAQRDVLELLPRDVLTNEPRTSSPQEKPPGKASGQADRRFFLTGHQPEFFHPGVWFKNFLIDHWAKTHEGIAIHVLVDHDLCRSLAVRLPNQNSQGRLRYEYVEPEESAKRLPWEWTYPKRMEAWRTFPQRVQSALAVPLGANLLSAIWPDCLNALESNEPVGNALAIGRNAIERKYGLRIHNVRTSQICARVGFAKFAWILMADRERLLLCYNLARAQYRAFFRIRNEAHPVPALASRNAWTEVPLRVYHRDDPVRRPVFVAAGNECFRISNGQMEIGTLPDTSDQDFIDAWMHWTRQGWCLRPRAISMTLYLRLFVSDGFVHGIGGGLYDQMTDRIIESWLGIEAPVYAIATATRKLQIPGQTFDFESSAALKRSLRLIRYHGERFRNSVRPLDEAAFEAIASKKRGLLNFIPPRGSKKNWHREISSTNRELESLLSDYRTDLQEKLLQSQQFERELAIRNSREHPYVLFAESLCFELMALATANG